MSNLPEKLMLRIIKAKVAKWFAMERALGQYPGAVLADGQSPEKSWPNPDRIPAGTEVPFSLRNIPIVGRYLKSSIHQGQKAIRDIKNNPAQASTVISAEQLRQFEAMALKSGIGALGYCKIPRHLIFKDRAVLYDTAVVLLMEMDKAAVMQAPSVNTFKMVMFTYDKLGKITNKLADSLRQMGFQAQASHPLGGLAVYPPLAVEAGLGWYGRHGLLISPQFGPRQRIAAIFVNIGNLPLAGHNPHGWIAGFCEKCGKCVRACPSGAILEKAVMHPSGRATCIVREKCLPVFVKQEGCTVCVKACAFTSAGYDSLHRHFTHV